MEKEKFLWVVIFLLGFGIAKVKGNTNIQESLKEIKQTDDTLIFRKEKLKDLAIRMEKKYQLKIEIQSEQLKEKRFSGTFSTETIQQALEALKLSYPLTYTISNGLVTIKD